MKPDNVREVTQEELTELLRESMFKYLMGRPMFVQSMMKAHKTPYLLPDKPSAVNILWEKEDEK